ncbi:MAG TPA: carboxymuconolactone decarboxylase family protein [Acidimicrobiia bacterium]|jgi:AhpD family alkylhydroperoxidase
MARIRGVDLGIALPPDADRATRIQLGVGSITAHRPDIAAGIGAATTAINTSGTLSPRLVELIRLRIAFHKQCRSCMAIRYANAVEDGVDEDLVCSLERPEEAEDLTPAERAALRFADLFATNHLAIDDAVYDDLRRYYTEGELVEIGLNCAVDVGMGRLVATWRVTDDLPERFREGDEVVTPWGGDEVVVPAVARR